MKLFTMRVSDTEKQMIDYLKKRKVNISQSVRSSLYFLYVNEKERELTDKK
jgi:hypothetical protein